jgi:hypothetical protein
MATKSKPGMFDCYSKAEPDEPMFVLLGRDATAPLIVMTWVLIRQKCGFNDEIQLREARECAQQMQAWAHSKGKKDLVSRARRKAAELVVHMATSVLSDALELLIEESLDESIPTYTTRP